jgi:hypothetical protein
MKYLEYDVFEYEEPSSAHFNEDYLESKELELYLDTKERVNDLNSEYSRCL